MASELGVQTIQHTNGTDALTIDSSGQLTVSNLDYLSVVFPSNGTSAPDVIDATSDFSVYLKNNLSVSAFEADQSNGDVFGAHRTHHTISGFSNGIYEFNVFFSMDRTGHASIIQIATFLEEDDVRITQSFGETETQGYDACGFSVIRDYTSSIPTAVKINFESDKSNYLTNKGCGYTIKRIA